jgi:LysR family glycine cleavage system transcriptional activator
MSFFRRVISSLDPLVFFEAAARHQSYSRAARELNVSQVAVSKRIRGLEAEVGRPLFVRQGRTIALTAEGHVFSERIRSGLAFLEDAVHAARATSPRSRQVIQVAANRITPSSRALGSIWLRNTISCIQPERPIP